MRGSKTEIVKSVSNMGMQPVTEASIGRETTLVVRPESSEYASTNKPLGKHVLDNVDHQLISSGTSVCSFHDNMVIGLRYKYTTKRVSIKFKRPEELFIISQNSYDECKYYHFGRRRDYKSPSVPHNPQDR